MGEAVLISLAGGLLGSGLAAFVCGAIRSGPATFEQIRNLSMDASVTTASLAIAVLIGLVSSFMPAWNASRVSVVESIRYSG